MDSASPRRVIPVACLSPPPGLEEELTPMKVIPGQRRRGGPQLDRGVRSDERHATMPFTTCVEKEKGGWLNAALATAPHLDSKGLKQAVQILEGALLNVKEAKGHEKVSWANGEIRQLQQQQLLQQLRALAPPGTPVAPPVPRVAQAACAVAKQPIPATPPGFFKPLATQSAGDHQMQQHMEPQSKPVQQQQQQQQQQRVQRQPPPGQTGKAVKAQQQPQHSPSVPAGRQTHTLSTSLQLLADVDPACLLIVRRINKLGFKASRKLKQHFSTYGAVMRVLVAHSTVKQQGDPASRPRRRPSSLGFVHMALPSAVVDILKLGENQDIAGSVIRVQRFERHNCNSLVDMEDNEATCDLEEEPSDLAGTGSSTDSTKLSWERQQTACSATSTTASCESEMSGHSSE